MTRNYSGMFLDVDSSIVEKNLCFTKDPNEEELSKLFPLDDPFPSKVVKPFPGFCVKTKEIGTEKKFFVNICHTDAIPPPKEISKDELEEIIENEDSEYFKVPMSIGDLKDEKDNKGNPVKTCDIAIHTSFFKKIQAIQLFKNFFLAVVFEGIKDKHKIHCVDEKIILLNKKCYGSLQVHRIQQRDLDEKMKANNMSVMEEVTGTSETAAPRPKIEMIASYDVAVKEPEYRLFKRKENKKNCLIGEFKFPDMTCIGDLTLDIGEDRILIESKVKGYLLDIFIPYMVRQESCTSSFEKNTRILTVTMPILGG